ncbi:hypothetical protein [Microbispora sp. GKU 823]|uniref:hypothetical protein n=1 Tax=Microbispora sp. GKU 823 TaxID=1652100 RepID=UPI002118A8AD|nr:hypothetical protein [Microbispora sp. GKU 823]
MGRIRVAGIAAASLGAVALSACAAGGGKHITHASPAGHQQHNAAAGRRCASPRRPPPPR